MRKLLTILFTLLTVASFGQYVTTPAVVADTTALKAYAGPSGLLVITAESHQGWYVKCSGCTVDYAKTFQGVGSRKWTRVVVPEIEEALNANQGEWGTFTGTLSDQTDLQAALDLKLNAASPTSTGNFKHGDGITTTIPNGAGTAVTPNFLVSVAGSFASMGVFANDGANNRRAGLFVDNANGVAGISTTFSTSSFPFVYRNAGGEWMRINANGSVRLQYYNTTAGYLKNQTDGDIESVTAIPQSDVTGLNTSLTDLSGDIDDLSDIVDTKADLADINYTPVWIKAFQAAGSAIKGTSVGADWVNAGSGVVLNDGEARFLMVYIPTDGIITGVGFQLTTQGVYTADNNNMVALYSLAGTTLTRIAVSTNDGNLWKAATGVITKKAFSAPVSVTAGLYYIGLLYNYSAATTSPQLNSLTNNASRLPAFDFTSGVLVYGYNSNETTLPTSLDMTTYLTAHNVNHFMFVY